jgi:hypothetical protein
MERDETSPTTFSAAEADEAHLVLFSRVTGTWENIRPIVEYAKACITSRSSAAAGERAGLVLHELLENAFKYGGGGSDVVVRAYVRSFRGFELRVTNRAVPSRIALLEKEIRRIVAMKAGDAFLESVRRAPTLGAGVSMIGLSRIRHEGEVELDVLVAGQYVTLVAKE